MTEIPNPKRYDLEERTLAFARAVRAFVKGLPKSTQNIEDGKQLIRSSGSIGANYIEANEAVSNKDFILRIKISRKEAKETSYWLSLVEEGLLNAKSQKDSLLQESRELTYILSAIMRNSKS